MTVFVFEKRYDYSEFGKMVEQRDLPFQQRAHWQYNRLDAYGAVMAGFEQPEQLEPFVAQQLAAIYVKSLGDVPGWFAEGSGRVFASSLAARDLDSRRRESEVTDIVRSMKQPDDFLSERLSPESASLVSYGFVKQLNKKSRHYQRLLAGLHAGREFDHAFVAAYGATPSEFAAGWVSMVR